MRIRTIALPASLLSVLAVSACGGGDDGPTGPSGPASVTISPATASMTYVGQTRAFRASVRDASGVPVTAEVAWASSDPAVFTVNASGTVTAVSNGSAQLEASVQGVTGTAAVTVEQQPTVLLVLSGDNQEATAGSPLPGAVQVQVTDQGGTGVGGVVISFAPGQGAGSVNPQNAVSDAGGRASTEWTLGGDRYGSQTLRVTIESGAATVVNARAVPESPIPDLAIEGGLVLSRDDPSTLETIDVTVRVANLGNAATPAVFPLTLSVDGAAVETFEIGELAVEERVNLTYAVGPLEAGSREIGFELDAARGIDEWSEDNNTASASVAVTSQTVVAVAGTGEVWSGQMSADSGSVVLLQLDVAAASDQVLTVRLAGGTGDADLFLHYGERPRELFDYRCFSASPTTNETCQTAPTRAGIYEVAVHAYSTFGPSTMTVTVGEDPAETYDIDVVFLEGGTTSQREVIEDAARHWESVLAAGVGDIDLSSNSIPAGACGSGSPAMSDVIDDIRIFVTMDSIDGVSNVLGQASPCHVRIIPPRRPGDERDHRQDRAGRGGCALPGEPGPARTDRDPRDGPCAGLRHHLVGTRPAHQSVGGRRGHGGHALPRSADHCGLRRRRRRRVHPRRQGAGPERERPGRLRRALEGLGVRQRAVDSVHFGRRLPAKRDHHRELRRPWIPGELRGGGELPAARIGRRSDGPPEGPGRGSQRRHPENADHSG